MIDKGELKQRLIKANSYGEYINDQTDKLIGYICNWLDITELEGFVDFVESEEKGE